MTDERSKAPSWIEAADDAAFAQGALNALPSVAVPAALERRILADFDAVAARPPRARFVGRLRDAVWPGAPVWKPASVLALSLVIGLAAGALVPSADLTRDTANQTQVSSSSSPYDSSPALDMSKDL